MCTLAIYRDVSARYPMVVAANRDEFHARPALAPARLDDVPGVIAGRDLQADGTWLGCRVDGPFLVAGLLNRRTPDAVAPSSSGERSRGLLCLDALRSTSVAQALDAIGTADAQRYGSFNLLLADPGRAIVVDNGAGLRRTELATGLSVLTNLDVNDPRCPRLASAVPAFEAAGELLAGDPPIDDVIAALADVLGNHESSLDPEGANPFARVCIHGAEYGTRSASIIVLERDGRVAYFHADGPPCRAAFRPCP